ncbi:MAG: hypothetical protein BJ554DRAFT_5702, partial [Olpidium bornovanus]
HVPVAEEQRPVAAAVRARDELGHFAQRILRQVLVEFVQHGPGHARGSQFAERELLVATVAQAENAMRQVLDGQLRPRVGVDARPATGRRVTVHSRSAFGHFPAYFAKAGRHQPIASDEPRSPTSMTATL